MKKALRGPHAAWFAAGGSGLMWSRSPSQGFGAGQPPFGGSLAEPDRGAEAVPEAADDASRGSRDRAGAAGPGFADRIKGSGPLGWLLLALGVAGVVLLVVADLSQISYRTIGIGACVDRAGNGVCTTTGHESHAWALVILAPFALIMVWGAVVGRSRAACVALVCVGAAVLLIALAIDQPKLDDKRGLEALYDDVVGHAGTAFKVELVAGVLLVLVGGLALVRPEGRLRLRRARPSGDSSAPNGETAEERRRRRRAEREAARAAGGS